ncbi:uncharacterized protein LOC124134756 [Haliotis rufescens]|uniref:uncharacterized protein LOC124134756 n=1 Tax=Haliotis rufescens TaxID=6454 RepID=UPI00201F021F|nr:uncharacterized protein LOC124134756 [Haliotis rufescens]
MKLPAISVCSRNYVKQANLTDAEKDVLMSPYVYNLFNNATGMEYSKADANAARNAPYGWGIKKEDFILKATIRKREVDVAAEFWSRCFVFNGVKDGDTGGELTLGHGEHLHMFMNVDQGRYLVRDTTAGVNYKFLPRPYKSFGDESCVDTQETLAIKELRWHSKYTWWSCVEECIVQETVHVCKCRSDSSIPDEFVNEKTWKLANLLNGSACQCPQPCQFVQYDLRTSLAAFPNLMLAESLVRKGNAESCEKMRLINHSVTDRESEYGIR